MSEPRLQQRSGEMSMREDGGVSLLWMLAVLVRGRRLILVSAAVGLVLGLVTALVRPRTYSTTFSFLPQSGPDPSRAGLASLAGQFGINLGSLGSTPQSPQLYADLLLTREVLGPIAGDTFAVDRDGARRVPLAKFLDVGEDEPAVVAENTLRALRKDVIATSVATRTTGMVTVSVRTESRYVSLGIAERLLDGLNHFNLITRQSQAREERRFTEGRLQEARASLRAAEDALERFLRANRQFAESPTLTFQRDRLQRDVLLQQQVVTALAQQYEENRIREVRDTPVITVIEKPIFAARPDPRLRALILLLGTVAGFFVGLLVVIARDAWTRELTVGSDPAVAVLSDEWRRIRGVGRS